MNPEGVHFSDENYDEGEEDDNGDGEDTPHGSNSTDVPAFGAYGASQRPFITCVGKKFGRFQVHRAIRQLIDQYSDGPWISSKHIPKEVIEQMWGCFKTLYVWDQTEDTRVKNNFKFVIKERYRDIMKEHREKSAKLAIAAGHDISEKGKDFDIMKDFVPRGMQAQAWEDMCRQWNTEAWLKRSASGTSNRNTTDSGGNISRHTGGSIGYDEHRIRLTAKLGRPPRFLELFFQTHLDKASKMKYLDGDDTGKKFCTETARELYEAYSQALLEKYGDDLHDQIDDAELWAKTQKEIRGASKNNYIYGVGSSDLGFVVTGKLSAAAGCSSSFCGSQHEVKELRTQLENANMETTLLRQNQEKMQQQLAQLMTQVGILTGNRV
ncbi:hypothetical protein L2E82_14774 [Cichorium intybus]|uniref:Uncharacterized protein n=1 Tax=Cichorium intybus TaxID=13427 RepID=A0ACB9F1H9_CICIN|nr:hypothetical protein L2E82_14774 [Cichorium intybus]